MHGEEAHGMKELSEELEEEKQAIQEMSFASLELRQEGTKKKEIGEMPDSILQFNESELAVVKLEIQHNLSIRGKLMLSC